MIIGGDKLRQARIDKGLSIEQLHQKTKIRSKHLEALENGEWEGIPGGLVTIKGFLRVLCAELDLDITAMLEAPRDKLANLEPLRGKEDTIVSRFRSPYLTLSLVVFVALSVLALLCYANVARRRDTEGKKLEIIQPEVIIVPDPLPTGVVKPSTPIVSVLSENANAVKIGVSSFPVALKVAVVDAKCWVSVIAGVAVETVTLEKGQQREFVLVGPFVLKLGYARGVSLTVNGVSLGVQTGVVKTYEFALMRP